MSDLIHGYRVTADELAECEVEASALDHGPNLALPGHESLEAHAATMMGERVIILSEGGSKPLNATVSIAADNVLLPIRGTAFVFGFDLELDGGYLCLPERAGRWLERAFSLRLEPLALEQLRDRARAAALRACDVMDAVDELMERAR